MEITERTFLDSGASQAVANLGELAAEGIRIGLDDFGTGYSNFAVVKEFPFTTIKIDRRFVQAIENAMEPAPTCTAITDLGIALGLTVIAEGVETEFQAARLRYIGCHVTQGYLYGRPDLPRTITPSLRRHAEQQR